MLNIQTRIRTDLNRFGLEYSRKISVPFSCLVFGPENKENGFIKYSINKIKRYLESLTDILTWAKYNGRNIILVSGKNKWKKYI
jgi:hypothetical protein